MPDVLKLNYFNEVQKNIEVKKGTVLISADHGEKLLFVLHSGSVGVYHPSHELVNVKNTRIEVIAKPQYFGFESYLPKDAHIPTFMCESDSLISIYPFKDIKKLTYNSTRSFLSLLRIMYYKLSTLAKYNNRLVSMANSFFTYNSRFFRLLKHMEISTSNLKFMEYNKEIKDEFSFSLPNLFVESSFDQHHYRLFQLRDFSFMGHVLSPSCEADCEALVKKNVLVGVSLFQTILSEYNALYEHIFYNIEGIHKEMGCLVIDDDSMLAEIKDNDFKIAEKNVQKFFSFVYSFLTRTYFDHPLIMSLYSRDTINKRLNLEISIEDEEKNKEEEPRSQELEESEESDALTLSEAHKSFLMGAASDISDTDYHKQVKQVNKFFLENWTQTFFEVIERGKKTKSQMLLLDKGIMDSQVLGKEEFAKILKYSDKKSENTKGCSVHTLYEWMEKIFKEEEVPSNNEVGLSFRKFMMEEMRMWSQKLKDAYEKKTPLELKSDKVLFELKSMVALVYRILNESPTRAIFPICAVNYGSVSMGKFVSKLEIQKLVDEICGYDFSLFYREVLFRTSEAKNIILEKEVKPLFIIFPCVGHNVVFWQEMVENKKTSQARFMIPMIFIGDLRKSMIEVLGMMRWGLCKAIKGVDWSDPINGGLTGIYMDYISFYSKNSQLLMDAKKKLKELLRNFRNNYKNVFVKQYFDWIEHERKGLVRLNNVEREIFSRFVPFNKDIREKLGNVPAYAPLIRRYENVQNKKVLSVENSFRKVLKKDGKYPEEIQDYLHFLNM